MGAPWYDHIVTSLARPLLTAEEFLASGDSDGFELVHGIPEEICMGGLAVRPRT